MTVLEFYEELDRRIPRSLSCEWDRDGLMCCPDADRQVKKVMIALDATKDVIARAASGGFDVILTHHPVFFNGLHEVVCTDPVAKRAVDAVRAGISIMCFHTRLDALEGGVNDRLAAALGLFDTTPFGREGPVPMGRIGTLPRELTLEAFAEHVKEKLHAPAVYVTNTDLYVRRVAVLGGEGKDEIGAAVEEGADTFVSGRFGYHAMTDLAYGDINLIEAGHFWTEQPVCYALADFAKEILPGVTAEIVNSNIINVI
ncbi:MAG: Nif3-like dinuclear metal center hexameric protein [Clostridia bacterium]|nr:Nif3-like dinuclear metal center hexameric protein [Clostridia bacterium]